MSLDHQLAVDVDKNVSPPGRFVFVYLSSCSGFEPRTRQLGRRTCRQVFVNPNLGASVSRRALSFDRA